MAFCRSLTNTWDSLNDQWPQDTSPTSTQRKSTGSRRAPLRLTYILSTKQEYYDASLLGFIENGQALQSLKKSISYKLIYTLSYMTQTTLNVWSTISTSSNSQAPCASWNLHTARHISRLDRRKLLHPMSQLHRLDQIFGVLYSNISSLDKHVYAQ